MITLAPMSEDEFQRYETAAVVSYAHSMAKSGALSEEAALEQSRKQHADLLPQGIATPNNYLFTIVETVQRQPVGILWFALEKRDGQFAAFVYDVLIYEEYRCKGYGSLAFRELEQKVLELGSSKIALHVFGYNHAAQEMYKKLGYEATNIVMAKKLDRQ